ncbi:DUF1642 domain-containing protein [Lactococcus garvieae]|uniref:DUF1642 domain-containing protein n=1 Tax=Lactococcus garvieae TaxID=1363 RepID=UPI0013FDCA01|nr:DUF1642 domain-containing protein [Lactococcus garvieae]NHI68991.1 DUF1642 domain-containing protein [Lactococcus garvieae]NHJ07549.1 DUF1642 domain-containing protein [Lactococcus garvieae]
MTKFELPEKPKKTNTSEDFNNLRKAVDELDKFDYAWKTHANKADRRINAANKYIEELERENQRLIAENVAVKTLVDNAKPQQALPVVPEHVADYISELKEKGHGIQFGLMCSTYDAAGEGNEKAIHWKDDNAEDFARAWLDGYTVEKPQLFYLKNKIELEEVGSDLIGYLNLFLTNGGYLTNNINRAKKFTKQEIDSMAAESYEQIEVVE